MRLLYAAFAVACLLFIHPAFAETVQTVASSPGSPVQTTTTIGIPIGDWLGGAAEVIAAAAAFFVAWLIRFLPGSIQQIFQTMQAEQLLNKAIDYAINAVAGAEKGKVLTIDTGNAVIAHAVQYFIDSAPAWLTAWVGGPAGVQKKILARIPLAPEVSVSPIMAATPAVAAVAAAPAKPAAIPTAAPLV